MRFGCFGVRHLHLLMASSALTVAFMARTNLSVAIVAMTNEEFPNSSFPVYDWDEHQRSLILSAFFWGYMLPQIFYGNLGEKFGSWALLLAAMILTALLSAIVPVAASYGYFTVCLSRALMGFFQGVFFPSLTVLVSKWIPPDERIVGLGFVYNGGTLGTGVGLLVSGYLTTNFGWPSAFYFVSCLAILWSILWFLLGASSPQRHRFISSNEKKFIEEALSEKLTKNLDEDYGPLETPWKKIITSVPLWAIVVCHGTHNWVIWLIATELPTYINYVTNADISKNGSLSFLPYAAALVTTCIFPFIAIRMNQRKLASATTNCKIWNSIGEWGSALGLLLLAVLKPDDVTTIAILMVFCVAINSGFVCGFMSNHVELSPNFCGTLMGITNSISTIGSILSPLSVGWLVKDSTSEEEWSLVFYLTAAIQILGNLFYVIFSSSEIQPWND